MIDKSLFLAFDRYVATCTVFLSSVPPVHMAMAMFVSLSLLVWLALLPPCVHPFRDTVKFVLISACQSIIPPSPLGTARQDSPPTQVLVGRGRQRRSGSRQAGSHSIFHFLFYHQHNITAIIFTTITIVSSVHTQPAACISTGSSSRSSPPLHTPARVKPPVLPLAYLGRAIT